MHSDGVEVRVWIGHLLIQDPYPAIVLGSMFSPTIQNFIFVFSVQWYKKHGMGGARSDRLDMHASSTYSDSISCFCLLLYFEPFACISIFLPLFSVRCDNSPSLVSFYATTDVDSLDLGGL